MPQPMPIACGWSARRRAAVVKRDMPGKALVRRKHSCARVFVSVVLLAEIKMSPLSSPAGDVPGSVEFLKRSALPTLSR